jgi:hypothetical protein
MSVSLRFTCGVLSPRCGDGAFSPAPRSSARQRSARRGREGVVRHRHKLRASAPAAIGRKWDSASTARTPLPTGLLQTEEQRRGPRGRVPAGRARRAHSAGLAAVRHAAALGAR